MAFGSGPALRGDFFSSFSFFSFYCLHLRILCYYHRDGSRRERDLSSIVQPAQL